MSYLGQPLNGVPTYFPFGTVENPVVASGSTDALPNTSATILVMSAGVNAMTLAKPKAGVYSAMQAKIQSLGDVGDDGKMILVVLGTAQLHTITTPTNGINGSKHLVTFTAVIANYVWLIAIGGKWYVVGQQGATIT